MHSPDDGLPGMDALTNELAESPEEMAEFETKFASAPFKDFDELVKTDSFPTPQEDHGSSAHITIRMPSIVLTAFKNEAVKQRIGYQTLMIRTLRDATSSFNAAPPTREI